MSSKPYVTALIDTYNHGAMLEEAIESVLAQDFPSSEMEILVVDDGSTDDTPERVKKYGDRVRYLRKSNGGQASAFNFGFTESRGEIVAFLDGDDVWLPGKVSAVVEEFERHPEAGLVCHPSQIWEPASGACVNTDFHVVAGFVPDRLTNLLCYGDYATSGMSLRRGVAEKLFPIPEDIRVFADMYIGCLIIFLAHVVARPEHLSRYRQHPENLTSFRTGHAEKLVRRWESYKRGVQEIRAWLARNGYAVEDPKLDIFLRRMGLGREALRFAFKPPGRLELVRFLRERRRVYGSIWTTRYRKVQLVSTVVAAVLGYSRYEAARDFYRQSPRLLRLRQLFFPHEMQEVAAVSQPGQTCPSMGGPRV